MDVPPIIRAAIRGVTRDMLGLVDDVEQLLDFGPTRLVEQDLCTGMNVGNATYRLPCRSSVQDVCPALHGAMFVRSPTDEGENLAGLEHDDPAPPIDNPFSSVSPKADPVLDLAWLMEELDLGQHGCAAVLVVVCS
jgi:hypothetical protein